MIGYTTSLDGIDEADLLGLVPFYERLGVVHADAMIARRLGAIPEA